MGGERKGEGGMTCKRVNERPNFSCRVVHNTAISRAERAFYQRRYKRRREATHVSNVVMERAQGRRDMNRQMGRYQQFDLDDGFAYIKQRNDFESLMTLNSAGEQLPIMCPLSTPNAWGKRDISQDRDRPSQM